MRHRSNISPKYPTSGQTSVRLCGRAIAALREPDTRQLVGYIYEWNTGEQTPAWLSGPVANAVKDPLTRGG